MRKVLSSAPIVDMYDKWVPAKLLSQVDRLIDLKKKNQTDVWVVIDAVVHLWIKKYPTEYRSFVIETGMTRDTRANSFGSNKKAGLRYTIDCPEWIHNVIRKLYDPDELVMDKEFWQLFWKRYPQFRVSEKV